MPRLILGTAGHIDHGKTALVKALTGVDTDRLKEEKERGITVDLGFAEFQPRDGLRFGVVDVPGHEGFIRNMLAGATGMDLVLLVVAADEGVMPQTREHLAIVRLLGVPRLAVALTKADLVEPDWMDLVEDEIREVLATTPYAGAPVIPVSAVSGRGLEELKRTLALLGDEATGKGVDDVVRLPIDRVFTMRGAGTVVTGTLWTGRLEEGRKVRLLPGGQDGRIRSLQVHGSEVEVAEAGARVAVGLSGGKVGHQELTRGQTLVEGEGWEVSWMLTCRVTLLPETGWDLEQGQRVRVHLGTAEVMARAALFGADLIRGGEEGWVQLRLEEPVLARARDHLVIRSYSPVTTIGGGRIAEVFPRKRRNLEPGEAGLLESRLGSSVDACIAALLDMAGWAGVSHSSLPQRTGFPPERIQVALSRLEEGLEAARVDQRLFSGKVYGRGAERILSAVADFHEANPLRVGIPLEELRQTLPGPFGPKLAEAILQDLARQGRIALQQGTASTMGFEPTLTKAQRELRRQLVALLEQSGLAPPNLREIGQVLGQEREVEEVLHRMEQDDEVVYVDGEFFFWKEAVLRAGVEVVRELAGSRDLGPADFRGVLPVSRKHLLPLLRYLDLVAITTRSGEGRIVAETLPPGWGTPSNL